MAEPKVIYKKKKYYDNKKKKDFVKKKANSNKIIDNRPKSNKIQKFDKGPKFRWQKISGTVKCPRCKIIYQIGNMPEYRCTWCSKLIWVDHGMQKSIHMTESD